MLYSLYRRNTYTKDIKLRKIIQLDIRQVRLFILFSINKKYQFTQNLILSRRKRNIDFITWEILYLLILVKKK